MYQLNSNRNSFTFATNIDSYQFLILKFSCCLPCSGKCLSGKELTSKFEILYFKSVIEKQDFENLYRWG